MRILRSSVALGFVVATVGFAIACGSSGGGDNGSEVTLPQPDSSVSSDDSDGGTFHPTGSNDSGGFMVTTTTSDAGDGATQTIPTGPLAITPTNDVVTVTYAQATMNVSYAANIMGVAVPASFAIDRGEIGSIVAATGVLTTGDTIGGTAHVTATYGGQTVSTNLTVVIQLTQNGAVAIPVLDAGSDSGVAVDSGAIDDAGLGDAGDAGATGDAGAGDGGSSGAPGNAGGNGGVGGNGTGGAVGAGTMTALAGTPAADTSLGWLYPYDNTVWPQGLLAPLLQWSTQSTYDGVYIHIAETGFDYKGYFASTGAPFVNVLVPQTAWDAIGYSNMGDPVTVTLVFSSGSAAYGPLTETWTFAQTALSGTVYYNSYGTNLAHNLTQNGVTFGGATLAIKHGATDPVLVAGNDQECRVCHSVSADGSRLVTQQATNPASSTYDLLNGYLETTMNPQDSRFAWGGLYPDGTFLISDSAPTSLQGAGWLSDAGSADAGIPPTFAPQTLFALPDGGAIPSSGIPAGGRMASPVFSPDGHHVAFNFYGGTFPVGIGPDGGVVVNADAGAGVDASADGGAGGSGPSSATADLVSLATMDFDVTTNTFSNFQVVFTPPSGTSVWPSFMPTNAAVVFELETHNNGRDWGGTRSPCDSTACASERGSEAEIWWVDVATKLASRLDQLNGKIAGVSYLPTLPTSLHTDDTILNYEPTVNPVPGGGFAWVVFTSRRLYGNVATIPPYWSDPRFVNLTTTPTPKKLWVAAIDLTGTPGTDVSHPAFYLPGQELLAGNSRGYWVVDPCEPNGTSCATGDQCCGGYCENVDGGFMCSAQPPACSSISDKCTTSADCCGYTTGVQCINSRCAEPSPPPPPPAQIAQ